MTEQQAIQQEGADARTRGLRLSDNPYYKDGNTPHATGEAIDDWSLKAMAWEIGWTSEDAMQPRTTGPAKE